MRKMRRCFCVYILIIWVLVLIVLAFNPRTHQELAKVSSLSKVDPTLMVGKLEENKEADYGLELRKDKLSKDKLLEKIEKENEEIVKQNNDNTLNKKQLIDKKKSLKHLSKNKSKVESDEKDDKRLLLNAKEKYIKNKMGRGVQEQIRDHGQGVVDKIVSELKHEQSSN